MTVQELWSLLNLYKSAFSGEQIDTAIGVIINGGIEAAVEEASRAASAAKDSAASAAKSATDLGVAVSDAESAARLSDSSAKTSESYALGGTGTREGEDEDNAKFYSERAKAQAQALFTAEIDERGHLVYTKPDGTKYDLGKVNGVSVTHRWNGTTLEVTSASGTSSADLKGPPGATGVYIGSDTPPEHANVWVNPAGDPTGTEDWEFDMLDGTTDEKTVVVIGAEDGSGRLGILRVRNADGTWTDIPAIVGAKGDKGDPGEVDYSRLEGYAQKTEVAAAVSEHNTSQASHNDIRLLIEGLTSRLNALANSDDTTLDQMAEVVAYIKANRDLIEQITTGKVSVSDIVDNLTTNVGNKPLSAAQGVALKALIDAIPAWAKAASKPTYTASEVGARPNTWTPSASDIGLKTETWTFTLADGNTVTKAVYVG